MVISHNIQAMNTNRIANENISLHGKSTEKVSSGYKINHVGDNPVGIAMSETMRRQIKGLNQGIENTKAAINFCQTADGALSEVTEMLQRINELAVKAENGTNLDLDRHYLQAEVDQLLTEIDRVADVTTFNEIPIFRGFGKEVVSVSGGSSVIEGDIPYGDFTLAPFTLGNEPFTANTTGNSLNLKITVDSKDPDFPANGKTYDMLRWYEHSFRLSYNKDGNNITTDKLELHKAKSIGIYNGETGLYLDRNAFEPKDGSKDANGNPYCQRTFIYKTNDNIEIEITQKITVISTDPSKEKKYNISYSFKNNSADVDVVLDFMSYVDTVYGKSQKDDGANFCKSENYYVKDADGNKPNYSCMYTDGGKWAEDTFGTNASNKNIKETIPDSFSMIDPKGALAFSEKVSLEQDSLPNAIAIGQPYDFRNNDWDYVKNNKLGTTIRDDDWGFSLYWNREIVAGDPPQSLSFNYGIAPYEQDDNIHEDIIIKKPDTIGDQQISHYFQKSLWIQTGSEKGSGLWLEIDEMNTEVLGIDKINLTTIEGAADANIRIKEALHKLAISRSKIGAQQNRLEHTVVNEENIVEKVTASESLIRDTDLSSEMVRYTNLSVLLQMGQNIIAQADQRVDKILTLLQ